MKAVIFDCDGVLVDSEVLYQEIELGAVLELGLTYDRQEYMSRFMGIGGKAWHEGVASDYQQQFGRPVPADFDTMVTARIRSEFKQRLTYIDGIPELVTSLTCPKAVASSTGTEFLRQKLQQTGLAQHFDPLIFSAQQVERAKPFPDLFLFTAHNLNYAPADCIVIEDSENGVKAGIAAGMYTIGFCGGGHCDAAHAQRLRDTGAHDVVMSAKELGERLARHLA